MEKKIALFSCHSDFNYGSMLQAYALHAAIKKLGKDSEYIRFVSSNEPPTGLGKIKEKLALIPQLPVILYNKFFRRKQGRPEYYYFNTPEFASTVEAFKRFHDKYIPCSKHVYYFNTVKKELDVNEYSAYMVGSDQLWSPNLYSPKKPYFLDFADLPKRCAYAPSMGTTTISSEFAEVIKDKLKAFNYLSCREITNSKFLSELTGKDVQHVLDPTLLLDSNDWDKITEQASMPVKGNYVLAYILGEKDSVIAFAEKLGKEKNLPVYYILTRPKYLSMQHLITGCGPDTFVNLVKNASYVVTDSYHGTIFSIIYKRNFYSFSKRDGSLDSVDNIRILEFLRMLGLESRFQVDENVICLKEIDYSNCIRIIDNLREESVMYLKNCLR